ncbi:transcriptional regulator [Methanoregula formicica SMSP]|uniref:Transcriptional regulator n=2 Tax=Methanoregula formicica TaxID=882104 RepID=L0HBH0_METFS|nr:transcriptional regulator [Methanoregula formicica SMSP]
MVGSKTGLPKITHVAKLVNTQFSETDTKIINYLFEKKQASYNEIAEALEISKPTVSRRVRLIQKEGLVISFKSNKESVIKWIGGTPALDAELESSTTSHITASMLAENYDQLICDPFSPFSLVFENHCWEVMQNLKEGLNDLELGQIIGKAISLDTIRRIMVTCATHNIIEIKTIRAPAGNDITTLFEPLYKIEKVNRQYIQYLTLIRGLASAMSYKMEKKASNNTIHPYAPILDINEQIFATYSDVITSTRNNNDREILLKALANYDFAPDLDRLFKHENWRIKVKDAHFVSLDSKSDNLVISKEFFNDCTKKVIKGVREFDK